MGQVLSLKCPFTSKASERNDHSIGVASRSNAVATATRTGALGFCFCLNRFISISFLEVGPVDDLKVVRNSVPYWKL